MATPHSTPATAFTCGTVNAAVWENTGEKGNWRTSASYGLNDLDALASVAAMAKDWVRGRAR